MDPPLQSGCYPLSFPREFTNGDLTGRSSIPQKPLDRIRGADPKRNGVS